MNARRGLRKWGAIISLLPILITAQITLAQVTEANSIVAVAWSPNGLQIGTFDNNGNLEIRDAATNILLITLMQIGSDPNNHGVGSIAWSPDGNKFAASLYEDVKVWDAVTWQEILTLSPSSFRTTIWSIAWSPDSSQLAAVSYAGRPQNFRIWDIQTGQEVIVPETDGYLYSVAWSQDGDTLVTAAGNGFIVWSSMGQRRDVFSRIGGDIVDAAWSPDGDQVASVGDSDEVYLWAVGTGETQILAGQSRNYFITSVRWSPDGSRIASVSDDGSLWVWDVATGEGEQLVQAEGELYTLAWSPDGSKIVYGGQDNLLEIVAVPDPTADDPPTP